MQIDFSIVDRGAWYFTLVYLIFAYGLWFLFPRFVQIRFSTVPLIKYVDFTYRIIYWLFLFLSLFITFKINIWFYCGLFIYLSGLGIYLSAIYFFAINELDKPVTSGVYRLLKHPVYFGFSLIIFGTSIASQSVLLFLSALLLSILSFIIARKEEQYCLNLYGKEYKDYLSTFKFFAMF